MNHYIFRHIKKHFSQKPENIDCLIVSAFLLINKIEVKNNLHLKKYIIQKEDKVRYKKLISFIELINEHFNEFNIESLIELFEFVISPKDRIITGAVYTPATIREFIIKNALNDPAKLEGDFICADIACGCGGFLFTLAREINSKTKRSYAHIFRFNIVGLDIKQYAIDRTKILLSLLALSKGEDEKTFHFNLFLGDALSFNWRDALNKFQGFTFIVGNPPYVCSRKIDRRTKKHLANFEVCSSGHPDLYIPFFQIGIELLKQNGFLGFITMNSFFKSLNARALRAYFTDKKLSFRIIDSGNIKVFKKKSTYTCICLIEKKESTAVLYHKLTSLEGLQKETCNFNIIPYSELRSWNGWNLQNSKAISKIESIGSPFSKKFKTRNGIATLKNDIYIFEPIDEDDDFYWLQNGDLYPIEKNICRDIVNSNYFTNYSSINSVREKCIFPYEFVDSKAKIYTEKRLREEYPRTFKYLSDKKDILAARDKGKGKYPKWFAFGRTQCLEQMKYKLFFPHLTPHSPNFVLDKNEDLLFYNGLAVIGKDESELILLRKLMSSRLFWYYLMNTSKPYTSGYLSMSKNYIKDFGIYDFSQDDIDYILKEKDKQKLDAFFEFKYEITL